MVRNPKHIVYIGEERNMCQIPAETSAAVIALWEISVHVGLLQMGRPGRVTQHFSGPLLCTNLLSLSLSLSLAFSE